MQTSTCPTTVMPLIEPPSLSGVDGEARTRSGDLKRLTDGTDRS